MGAGKKRNFGRSRGNKPSRPSKGGGDRDGDRIFAVARRKKRSYREKRGENIGNRGQVGVGLQFLDIFCFFGKVRG